MRCRLPRAERTQHRSAALVLAMLVVGGMVAVGAGAGPARAASSCPSGGVVVPVDWSAATWQQQIDQHAAGTTWCVADGVHTILAPLVFHTGDTVVGIDNPNVPGSPTISGAEAVTGWTQRSTTTWKATVSDMRDPQRDPGLVTTIACLDGTNHCYYPDDVYFGETHPKRVWSLADLDAATAPAYYEDYNAKAVAVNRDPSTMTVERAVPLPRASTTRGYGLIGNAMDMSIRDLTVEKAGTAMQTGAINAIDPRIQNVDVHLSHAAGIGVVGGGSGLPARVQASHIHDNGQVGFASFGGSPTYLDNGVTNNGWLHCDDLCGGMKLAGSNGGVIGSRGHGNVFEGNDGPGVWTDASAINFSIRYNTIADNTGAGVALEASYDGIIANNDIFGNGIPRWKRDQYGGIWINASGSCSQNCPSTEVYHGIKVAGNVVGAEQTSTGLMGAPNAAAIKVKQANGKGSGAYGPWEARDIHVTRNTIWQCPSPYKPQWLAGTQTNSDWAVYDPSHHITWDYNKYAAPSTSKHPFHWWGYNSSGDKIQISIDWLKWRSNARQDAHSTYSKSISC